jgi:iron complex transport system permease protein
MTMSRIYLALALGLAAVMVASLHIGLRVYGPGLVWEALRGGDGTDALIISTLRVPRTLIGAVTGAMLGLSGLLMQAATRNPLAEPGLLGINAGAGLAVVIALSVLGTVGLPGIAVAALIGAFATTALVFGLSLLAGRSVEPTTILLTGVTIAAMFAAVTHLVLLIDEAALETLLFWLAGGFADRDLPLLRIGLPLLLVGLAGSAAIAGALDVLRADDNSAAALGVPVMRTRISALALAALLAGGAVAMAGPIAFLGLVAPHLARRLPGIDEAAPHAQLMVLTGLTGALLAVTADILARVVVAPGEAPVGTLLAAVGVPTLILLLRRGAERPA